MSKDYELEFDVLYNDRGISVIFSKGHHDLEEFYYKAKDALMHHYDFEKDDPRLENLDESKQVWAKKVGFFEDGERTGYTLKESDVEKIGHGWFSVTIADIG